MRIMNILHIWNFFGTKYVVHCSPICYKTCSVFFTKVIFIVTIFHSNFHFESIMVTRDLLQNWFSKLFLGFHFWTFLKMSKFHFPFYFLEQKSRRVQNFLETRIFKNLGIKLLQKIIYIAKQLKESFMEHFGTKHVAFVVK